MEWTREQRELPPLDISEDDMMRGLKEAENTPGCFIKTQGDCNFAARLACRERQLTAALDENARLRQPVVTATGIIMSFVAYCAGNDRVPEHFIGAAKEWLKANDPSFGNPAKGAGATPRSHKRWRVVEHNCSPSGEQAAEKRCTCKTDCHFNCGGYNCDCVLHA